PSLRLVDGKTGRERWRDPKLWWAGFPRLNPAGVFEDRRPDSERSLGEIPGKSGSVIPAADLDGDGTLELLGYRANGWMSGEDSFHIGLDLRTGRVFRDLVGFGPLNPCRPQESPEPNLVRHPRADLTTLLRSPAD